MQGLGMNFDSVTGGIHRQI